MRMMFLGLAALAAVGPVGAVEADALQQSPAFGARSAPAGSEHGSGGRWGGRHGRHHGGYYPGLNFVERPVPVIVEREVVREVVKEVAAEPPPPPRKPYVLGASYASLPGGCMKMIEGSASYYYCGGGEWYRPVGKQYRAVREP